MKSFVKFFISLFVVLGLLFPPMAMAQVFDPLSRSLGGSVSGPILYVGLIPAVIGTGTPTIQAGSTNKLGVVTAGASATSVVITFANGASAYPNAVPSCMVASRTQLAAFAYVVTALTITITQTATSGNLIDYNCNPMG